MVNLETLSSETQNFRIAAHELEQSQCRCQRTRVLHQLGQLIGCRRGPQHVVIVQWVTFQCQRLQRHELLIDLFPFDKDNFERILASWSTAWSRQSLISRRTGTCRKQGVPSECRAPFCLERGLATHLVVSTPLCWQRRRVGHTSPDLHLGHRSVSVGDVHRSNHFAKILGETKTCWHGPSVRSHQTPEHPNTETPEP